MGTRPFQHAPIKHVYTPESDPVDPFAALQCSTVLNFRRRFPIFARDGPTVEPTPHEPLLLAAAARFGSFRPPRAQPSGLGTTLASLSIHNKPTQASHKDTMLLQPTARTAAVCVCVWEGGTESSSMAPEVLNHTADIFTKSISDSFVLRCCPTTGREQKKVVVFFCFF